MIAVGIIALIAVAPVGFSLVFARLVGLALNLSEDLH